MDAYSSYIKQLSDIRVGELRREAADYRLSQLARSARGRWWRGENRWFRRPAWTRGEESAPGGVPGVTARTETLPS